MLKKTLLTLAGLFLLFGLSARSTTAQTATLYPTFSPSASPFPSSSPSPTPSPRPSPAPPSRVRCATNADCQTWEACYQPPMPECPAGQACIQLMPAKYCVATGITLGQTLPTQLPYTLISTTSRYPTNYTLSNLQPQIRTSSGDLGYAQGFKFEAQAGQKLESLVAELDAATVGSYVRTYLYGPDQQLITSADTRIQFDVATTGTYYLIASTFASKQGDISVQVYDRLAQKIQAYFIEQTSTALNPRLLTPGSTNVTRVGRYPFLIRMDFPDTVTVNAGLIEYFSKEAGRVIRIMPSLYRGPNSIISQVQSHAAVRQHAIITKTSDKSITLRPADSDFFAAGAYYGLLSEVVFNQPGVSGSNYETYFAAISPTGGPADLNNDGRVNIIDYSLLAQEFMSTKDHYQADINDDGRVNIIDYSLLAQEFSIN